MCKNHRSSAVGDYIGENLPWMNRTFIKKADGDHTFFDDLVCAVERDADEIFLLFSSNIGYQGENILGDNDLDSVPKQVPPREFKGR